MGGAKIDDRDDGDALSLSGQGAFVVGEKVSNHVEQFSSLETRILGLIKRSKRVADNGFCISET